MPEQISDVCAASHQNADASTTNPALTFDAPTRLRIAAWCVAVTAGFLQVWVNRFYTTPDGNNYLDVASAYLRHDWFTAISGWWSPMLSWILAGIIYVTKLPGYWEITAIHFVDLAGLLVSLFAFERFMRALLKHLSAELPTNELWVWWLLGYSLFLSSSFYVLSLKPPTPDVWVAGITLFASEIIVRIRRGETSYAMFTRLGLVLGLGYLFKSFFFPLSLVFLLTAWWSAGRTRKTVLKATIALLAFSAVSGPFVFALSRSKHRFTFGDTGRMAYFMFITRTVAVPFWEGGNGTGTPVHPLRKLLERPNLYEFATPLNASYPPYYDISYWMEGAVAHFRPRAQLAIFRQSAGTYYLIWAEQAAFSVGLLALIFAVRRPWDYFGSLLKLWYVWFPSLMACIAYSLVLTEERYVASFVLVLWIAAFFAIALGSQPKDRPLIAAVVLAMCCVSGVRMAKSMTSDLIAIRSDPATRENVDWDVAQALHAVGIIPGDRVAGLALMGDAHWARLAGIRVVAEIPLGQDFIFWNADDVLRQRVMAAFLRTGARAIVVKGPLTYAEKTQWKQLANTNYYIFPLK
jgi:hypothetical protein